MIYDDLEKKVQELEEKQLRQQGYIITLQEKVLDLMQRVSLGLSVQADQEIKAKKRKAL